jgi:hypothetical protein
MPATPERLRREMDIKSTPKDVGLTLTITLTAYDTGMLMVDGTPMVDHQKDDDAHAWLTAGMVLAQKIRDFQRVVAKRQMEKRADH